MNLERHYLDNAIFEFRRLKRLAEGAMEQIPDHAGFHRTLDEASNSIAVIVQHLGGNMVSRWTDFLTTDGEKPDRHRDREFEPSPERSVAELMEIWDRGWNALFESLEALSEDDVDRTVVIRGEDFTVPEAIQRQIVHAAYHIGQIVHLARYVSAPTGWKSLSIPKGASDRATGRYKNR